jgi:hypothetical protein
MYSLKLSKKKKSQRSLGIVVKPAILATREVEVCKISVQGHPRQKV